MELALVAVIDLIAIVGLIILATSKGGLERALPFATFLIVLTPIESLLPLGFFTLTTHRIIIAVLAILYLVRGRGQATKARLPLKALIMVHVVWCLIATANSIVPLMSAKKLVAVVLEYYVLYFVFYKTITKAETIQKILFAVVLALVVSSVGGAFEAYQDWNVLDYFPTVGHHFDTGTGGDREVRVHATFDHAILFGAALAMAIVMALHLMAVVKRQAHLIFLWLGLMLMFLNIYKTSSRGPWIDVMVGCAILMFFGQNKTRRALLCIAGLSVAVLILRPGVWSTIDGIYQNTFGSDTATGSSYLYRYALQDAAVKRLTSPVSTRTLWGYGPESFFDVHLEGMLEGKPHTFLSCDNAWVEFLIETGFVGLGIIVLLLAMPMLSAMRQVWRLPKSGKGLALLFLINFVMCYFQMYSVGLYSWGQNGYMLWIVIALTYAHAKLYDKPANAVVEKSDTSFVDVRMRDQDVQWWEPAGNVPALRSCEAL